MPLHSSILCAIPVDVLFLIALELTLLDPLGPPSELPPLLLTCRHVYNSLCFQNAPHLYARIFRCKFDTRAALRRMGPRAMRSKNLALQLKKVSRMLTRIRKGDICSPHLEDDLWTAFIMCMENDGKNQHQLEWCGIDNLVDNFICTRLWERREYSNGWPAESTINSLAIWIFWFRQDADKLASMPGPKRQQIIDLIRPYVLTALRYPSFHAPDNHFDFPLPEELQDDFPYTLMTPHGFYPLYRQPSQLEESFPHFGLGLKISAPLIAQGAKLLFMTLQERPLPYLPNAPRDRQHAIEIGWTTIGPTCTDVDEANAHKAVRLTERGEWNWRSKLNNVEGALEDDGVWRRNLKALSAQWDNDWHRLTGCIDPWGISPLKGPVYTHGTLTGLWHGRLLVPDFQQYMALVTSTSLPNTFSSQDPRLYTSTLWMNLREHHCINPEHPVRAGGTHIEYDDGVGNAYFPTVTFREAAGRVRVEDEALNRISRYETWVEGRPNSHSPETCTQCRHSKEMQEGELRERVRAITAAAAIESEREGGLDAEGDNRTTTQRPQPTAGFAAQSQRSSPGPSGVRTSAENVQLTHAWAAATAALGRDVDVFLEDMMLEDDEDSDEEDESGGSADDESKQKQQHEYAESVEGGEEGEEVIVNTCNGVCDIIVTGETLPHHGQAWNHYRFYGRVRRWDGLIVLLRVPAEDQNLGVFIFRGYLVGSSNFVGSWRHKTDNPRTISLEGPFAVNRVG